MIRDKVSEYLMCLLKKSDYLGTIHTLTFYMFFLINGPICYLLANLTTIHSCSIWTFQKRHACQGAFVLGEPKNSYLKLSGTINLVTGTTWASSRENLSLGFSNNKCADQSSLLKNGISELAIRDWFGALFVGNPRRQVLSRRGPNDTLVWAPTLFPLTSIC